MGLKTASTVELQKIRLKWASKPLDHYQISRQGRFFPKSFWIFKTHNQSILHSFPRCRLPWPLPSVWNSTTFSSRKLAFMFNIIHLSSVFPVPSSMDTKKLELFYQSSSKKALSHMMMTTVLFLLLWLLFSRKATPVLSIFPHKISWLIAF